MRCLAPSRNNVILRPLTQGRKNSININFLVRIPAAIPDPYARMPRGQNVSPHHRGCSKTHLLVRASTIFCADVHDPKGCRKTLYKKRFALIFWPHTNAACAKTPLLKHDCHSQRFVWAGSLRTSRGRTDIPVKNVGQALKAFERRAYRSSKWHYRQRKIIFELFTVGTKIIADPEKCFQELISKELLILLRDGPCLELIIVSSNFQALLLLQEKLLESV